MFYTATELHKTLSLIIVIITLSRTLLLYLGMFESCCIHMYNAVQITLVYFILKRTELGKAGMVWP